MDPATPAAARAVIIGLLLAAVSAGSLVALSLIAGRADDTVTQPVVPIRPVAVAAPFVFEQSEGTSRDRVLGTRVEPGRTPSKRVAPIVLGTRVRNNEPEKKKEPRTTDATVALHAPERSPSCRCGHSTPENGSNGNAYGHDKNKAQGNAYGHSKTNGASAKSSKKE